MRRRFKRGVRIRAALELLDGDHLLHIADPLRELLLPAAWKNLAGCGVMVTAVGLAAASVN